MDTAKGTSRHITSSQGLGAVLPDRPVRAGGRTPFEAMKNPRKCRSGEPPPGILTGIEQLRKQTSAYGHAFTIRSRSGAFGAYPAAGSPRTCTRARASGRRGRPRVRSVITEPATTTLRSAARPRARRGNSSERPITSSTKPILKVSEPIRGPWAPATPPIPCRRETALEAPLPLVGALPQVSAGA